MLLVLLFNGPDYPFSILKLFLLSDLILFHVAKMTFTSIYVIWNN
jgi:hypothetical protein